MLVETEAAHALRRAPAPCRWDRSLAPCAGPNAGQRRSTPAGRRAEALADAWTGLPEGVTRWRLVAALRAAARTLGLSSAMLRLMEHYVDLSYDQDWSADSEPVICRPLVEIAEHLGRSERQVRNIERALVERGLLAFRDSGNHARKGRRDRKSGQLIYAYGPSLAPLGARAAEVIALAAAARAEIAESRRLRMAVSALRRRLKADIAAAEAMGIDARTIRLGLAAAPTRLPAAMPRHALQAVRDALADLAAQMLDVLGGVCPNDGVTHIPDDRRHMEISGQQAILTLHNTDTSLNHTASGSCITVNDKTDPIRRPETPSAQTGHLCGKKPQANSNPTQRSDNGVGSVPLALARLAAGPEISALIEESATVRGGRVGWPSVIDAARGIAPMLGIDQTLWAEACARLGRGGAALAVIILERGATRVRVDTVTTAGRAHHYAENLSNSPFGPARAPIRHPSAYLRELLARADRNALHLDRSIRALAARSCAAFQMEPE